MNAKRYQFIATARCHPKDKADNRGVAEGEDGYFNGTTGLPVGIHFRNLSDDHHFCEIKIGVIIQGIYEKSV
jgi:hypothetical protein